MLKTFSNFRVLLQSSYFSSNYFSGLQDSLDFDPGAESGILRQADGATEEGRSDVCAGKSLLIMCVS